MQGAQQGAETTGTTDLVQFTAVLIYPIYEKGDFSIWSVDVVGDALVQPDGRKVRRLVIKGEGIRSEIRGGHLNISGKWATRSFNGSLEYQIETYSAMPKLPQSQEGMIAFLESPYIKGCGPVTARKIVDLFGEDTWDVLDREPGRLSEIKGLGKKQRERIAESYAENVGFRDIITDLAPYGIGPALAVKIARHVPDARRVILEDPYSLCDNKIGVGFKTADKIALTNNLDAANPSRVAAALNFELEQTEGSGHCHALREQLIAKAWSLLRHETLNDDNQGIVGEVLDQMLRSGLLIADGEQAIYRRVTYYLEKDVARLLIHLLHAADEAHKRPEQSGAADAVSRQEQMAGIIVRADAISLQVDEAATRLGFVPAPAQREAAIRFFTEPLMVLTGIPGSGKTSTLKLILESLGQEDDVVLLCAPTGRAARRMSEQTGRPAKTIHSALQLDPESEDMPDDYMDYKTIIIDEASMIDLNLMHKLLSRIAPGSRLLITGDPYQLPSVGAGNVLNDLIQSGHVPVVRLTVLFRQQEGSEIATNAKAIREGRTDLIYNKTSAFQTATSTDDAADLIHKLYLKAIEFTGSDEEVVCLTPLRQRTATGSNALNRMLKESLNPVAEGAKSISYGDKVFHTGDRVMMMRNTKLTKLDDEEEMVQVSNGDTGRILSIYDDGEDDTLAVVEFNGESYVLDASQFQFMDWAYACTVHKSQGSEYRFVILCLMNAHYVMLKRNLIYTAFTRAKENIIIVGEKSAVNRAIETEDSNKRLTGLVDRLAEVEAAYRESGQGNGQLPGKDEIDREEPSLGDFITGLEL